MNDELIALLLISLAGVICLYLLPTFIAFGRLHPNRWIIFALNLFLGETGIVWVICLIWAFHKVHDPRKVSSIPSGGESGVNVFANDVKSVRLLLPDRLANQPSASSQSSDLNVLIQLEKLGELKQKGILTDKEFQIQKAKMLSFIGKE